MFYGSQIFRFVGVLVAWVLFNLFFLILNKKRVSFSKIWKGPTYDDAADGAMYEMKYIFFGAVMLFIICHLVIKLGF